jgi:hypothetical protein
LAQQGSPPGRPPREPDLGRRGYDREPPADRAPRAGRPERHARPEGHARPDEYAERPDSPRRERPDSPRRERPDSPRRERPDSPRRERSDSPRRERADRRADRPGRSPAWSPSSAFTADTDADLPPWAGPPIQTPRAASARLRAPARVEDYPEQEHPDAWEGEERPEWPEEDGTAASPPAAGPTRRSGRRAAAARLRKSRRRVYVSCGLAIVACIIAAVVFQAVTGSTTAKLPYVTSLQPGEFTSVPDSCSAVSAAVLSQYVPDTGSTAATRRHTVATQSGSTDSECSFTVDNKPDFVVLTVGAQSFQPFAAASGDGSASDNALDQFLTTRLALAHPPRRSAVPPATITALAGLGKQAFVAVAAEHVGHLRDDVVTVVALDRNVIITAEFTGQESGGFGPVSYGTLEAGARAAAASLLAQALRQPTA